MAVLKATRGLAPGTTCKLETDSVVVGRNPKVCDIVLEHFAVSREHASIEKVDSSTYVVDLDSRNGVVLNGQMIQPGTKGRRRLYSGDRLEIAAFEFIYDEDPSTDDLVFMADDAERPGILSTLDCSTDSSKKSISGTSPSKLETLVGIIEDISDAIDLDRVLPKIITSLFRAFRQAQSGCVLLRDESGVLTPAVAQVPKGVTEPMSISRDIIDEVVDKRYAILASRASSDSAAFRDDDTHDSQRSSVMSAPMLNSSDEVIGVIQLEIGNEFSQFNHSDLELLGAVARHLAIVVENSKLHEHALRQQRSEFELRFKKLIEGSVQGISIHRFFKPLFVNKAWATLHGYSVEEVLAMESILPMIAPDDREQAMSYARSRIRGEDAPTRYESQDMCRDGSTIWVEKFVTVVEWDGQPAIQSSVVDLSQRKEAEITLQNAHDELDRRVRERTKELATINQQLQGEISERQRNATELERSNRDLEQFAYSVSHDLQAPLRTISGYCQLLQRRYKGHFDTDADGFLAGAVDGTKRMKRLLDDLLTYSRVATQTRPFDETDCNLVVDEVRNNLGSQIQEAKAELTTDKLPVVIGDRSQLMQLFQNVVGNAIAYRSERPLEIHISYDDQPDESIFCIRDNGVGIDEHQYERIFQIFQRLFAERERPGSGVGLSICKRIVERHGGRMWLKSELDVGSEFFFTIAKRPVESS
jgi:PAS domain S-box-containing protein